MEENWSKCSEQTDEYMKRVDHASAVASIRQDVKMAYWHGYKQGQTDLYIESDRIAKLAKTLEPLDETN